ncbi:c-type cytochrome [Aquihabitans daechungensis]|uniref:c-type cytochrome n=1 Tax=Aquihabitans daechungensis TaxID=1052257 RepID=UPI003BA36EAC
MLRRSLVAGTIAVSIGLGALVSACGSDAGGPEVELSAAGERGKTVATEQNCVQCHSPDGKKAIGPTWKDLAGSTVTLDDGTEVVADDAYLRTSILQSKAQVVDGYSGGMPIYEGELTDAEVDALIAYLHDLAPTESEGTSGSGS